MTLSVVVLLVLVSPAWALDLGEWVRGLKLRPSVSEQAEYVTNVFQIRSRTQDDVIFHTAPGIGVDLERGPVLLRADYTVDVLRFVDFPDQDTEHHLVNGRLKLEFARSSFELRDDFANTTSPATNELVGRFQSTTNTLAAAAEYKLTSRFSAGVNYTWASFVGQEEDIEELGRDEHLFGASVFWRFLPKSDLSLNYTYGTANFEVSERRDFRNHQGFLALRGDLTAKLTSTFRAGFGKRESVEEGVGIRDVTTYTLGGGWIYSPTDRTTFGLFTDRNWQESIFQLNQFFITTTGTLTVNHRFAFNPKLAANARVTFGDNKYPVKDADDTRGNGLKFRRDDLFSWGAGVDYDIQRWLRVGAGYSHIRRESNFDSFDYKDDRFAATISVKF